MPIDNALFCVYFVNVQGEDMLEIRVYYSVNSINPTKLHPYRECFYLSETKDEDIRRTMANLDEETLLFEAQRGNQCGCSYCEHKLLNTGRARNGG